MKPKDIRWSRSWWRISVVSSISPSRCFTGGRSYRAALKPWNPHYQQEMWSQGGTWQPVSLPQSGRCAKLGMTGCK